MLGAVQTRRTNTNVGVCPQAILQTKGETETRSLEFTYMLECTLNTSQKTLLSLANLVEERITPCVSRELSLQPFVSHP